jgi:hypothetical protein
MSNAPKKSANKSGVKNTVYRDSVLGGVPEKKSVEAVDKANSAGGRGRAPGSVRK